MLFTAALAAVATFATPILSNALPKSDISVELTREGNTLIKAVVTNNAKEEISIFKPNSLFDPAPVKKLDVVKDSKFHPGGRLLDR